MHTIQTFCPETKLNCYETVYVFLVLKLIRQTRLPRSARKLNRLGCQDGQSKGQSIICRGRFAPEDWQMKFNKLIKFRSDSK